MADNEDCEIILEPFIHQVGGSSPLLKLDQGTLCKPLIKQEKLFYENLPECLKPFTPQYKGLIEVDFTKDIDGYLTFTTTGTPLSKVADSNQKSTKCRVRVNSAGNVEIISLRLEETEESFDEDCQRRGRSGSIHNPWVLRCHTVQVGKMKDYHQGNSSAIYHQKCILLENLTSKYKYPCIIDLKMGVRHYGDRAPISKQVSHNAKVANTTSGKLGVRICGMQVYHQAQSHYLCHNKYYGRSLDVEGFRETLQAFLHNGKRIRRELLPFIVDSLKRLQEVVRQSDTFRFFTSSLLIIYDGQEWEGVSGEVISEPNANFEGHQKEVGTPKVSHKDTKCPSSNSTPPEVLSEPNANFQTQSNVSVTSKVLVDVRMIDFAHSTAKHVQGDMEDYTGLDESYLFGLENLIREFRRLENDPKVL